MGGGKGGDQGRQQDGLDSKIYDQFYNASKNSTADWNSSMWGGASDRAVGAQMGWEAGMADRASSFEMPPLVPMMRDMMEQQASNQAEFEAQQAELYKQEGLRVTNQAYGSYMDAAGTATDYVNNEITQEQSNARLLGIDYQITDDQKTQRVNDYFATIWGESDQAALDGYMKEFGNPEGFSGFSVTRGDASNYEGTESSEESVSSSKGLKPTILTEDEEEGLGGQTNILGV